MPWSIRISKIKSLAAALCAAVVFLAGAAARADIDSQRELFRQIYPQAELGIWEAFEALPAAQQKALKDYVLWPDLRAAYFKSVIQTAAATDIEKFLTEYGELKPGRELRYRYALELVRRHDLAAYHELYQAFYEGLGITKLDCLALQAEIAAGHGKQALGRARELWLVGRSQLDECDPVFDYLKDAQLLTAADTRKRFELAIEAREFRLARWLGKSIDEAHVETAERWLDAQLKSAEFLAQLDGRDDNEALREQLVYAAERLTYQDPDLSHELWSKVAVQHDFSAEQLQQTARHIALWTARDNLPEAYARLVALPAAAVDDEVLRWRARSSLRREDWPALIASISGMSAVEQRLDEWVYWRAIAARQTGAAADADTTFEKLAGERSYYGFLAADELDLPYAFAHTALAEDKELMTILSGLPELIRARELFNVGLDGRGRSEWDAAVTYFTPEQKLQAANLAHQWGWHSRAIATAAGLGEYDDLLLRYPLPYRETFEEYSVSANIPSTWALGIARSESLFMRDIRSSAGAIGLMQLMPATGAEVAASLQLPYSGLNTLTDPTANIRLGTAYLGSMAERFDGNRIMATAAYNAGPHRVENWRPDNGAVEARVWIENIPFNETRKYVRRVLEAESIFYWRLTGETRRISDELVAVRAAEPGQRVARASR